MGETIDVQRRRLRFRSWHRGTRELDLVLGPFADRHLDGMTPDQLDRYEALLTNPDLDLYHWISGAAPIPAAFESDIMELIRNFQFRELST